MKLLLAAFGRPRSRDLAGAAAEYLKRLRKYASLEVLDLKEERGDDRAARRREAARLEKTLRAGDFLVLCDGRGRELSSPELAALLARRERAPRGRTVFLVGGPYGVDGSVRRRADLVFSMSRLTENTNGCLLCPPQ